MNVKKSGGKFVLFGGHDMQRRLNLEPEDVIALCEKRLNRVRSFLQKHSIRI
jgi:hypothetical protein